jgi:hypothetical protein
VVAKASAGIRFNEHMEYDDGETVFRHACKMGLEGIDLSLRPIARLAQDEEPERARGAA